METPPFLSPEKFLVAGLAYELVSCYVFLPRHPPLGLIQNHDRGITPNTKLPIHQLAENHDPLIVNEIWIT